MILRADKCQAVLSGTTRWAIVLCAVAAVGGCGDPVDSLSPYCDALRDPATDRAERVEALKRVVSSHPRTRQQIDCLSRFIASKFDSQLRILAMDAVLQWDQDARHLEPALFRCLEDPDARVRERAAASYAFLESDSVSTLERLRETASRDSHARVRAAALNSLGMLGDEAATGLLVRSLADQSEEVRLSAATGLANLDAASVSVVRALVVASRDPVPEVSLAAHMALVGKEPSGLVSGPVFLRAARSPVADLRMWAAYGLGHLVRPEAAEEYVAVLVELLDHDNSADVQRAAAGALASYGAVAKSALDSLKRAMDRGVVNAADSHARISTARQVADRRDRK